MSTVAVPLPSPLYTVQEAAGMLGVSRSAIYGWARSGDIDRTALVRMGVGKRRAIRVKAWWVDACLRSGEMPRVRKIGRGVQ